MKRIIGLPGETGSPSENGVVYVERHASSTSPTSTPDGAEAPTSAPITLGPDEYFMMGDNRALSCDSRRWGPITRDDLVGPVFFVYWPPNRIGFR